MNTHYENTVSTQDYRNKFIREMDRTNNSTTFAKDNADSLFNLGLTMYSGKSSFESILYNSFAISALDDNISLHPEQRKVLNLIEKSQGLIFSAPTSFGKTFVIFEYICRHQPNTVVLVVPSLALLDEYKQKIIKRYKDKFSSYTIYTDIDINRDYNLNGKTMFIVTHDRVIEEAVLQKIKHIDFLVIDEVYKLEQNLKDERVLILNIAYYNMMQICDKYVLLAPFIKGIKNIDKLDKVPIFYATDYSPVVNDIKTVQILNKKDRNPKTEEILYSIPSKEKTLIYFPTVTGITTFLDSTTISYDNQYNLEDNEELNLIKRFIEWAEAEIHPEWTVIEALKRGFLIHHGQLPRGIRSLELELFNKSSYFTKMLCTSTILEGINTNAKNIIITKPYRNSTPFEAFDFFNLVGRTGRLFEHYLGIAYYIKGPNDPIYKKDQALKSIEFELTSEDSIDMDINIGEYEKHEIFKKVLTYLGITYEEYREKIAKHIRFETVLKLLKNFNLYKNHLFAEIDKLQNNPVSKLELIRAIAPIIGIAQKKHESFIVNRLTYKRRQTTREVIESTLMSFHFFKDRINELINIVIRYRSSIIEYQFYQRTSLLCYIMDCLEVPPNMIATIQERILSPIEELYFLNSPQKRMLKDMGFYDSDINYITKIIGTDYTSLTELRSLLIENKSKMQEQISIISLYILNRI